MKNISLIANGIIAVAVAVLFILHFTQKKSPELTGTEVNKAQVAGSGDGELKIAYVNIDSLLTHFKMAQDMSGNLLKRKESLENELKTKGQALEKSFADYQYKVQKGLITSWDAAELEKRLTEQQQVFVNLQNDMQNRLLTEEQDANLKVHTSVIKAVEEYNKSKGYNIILSHAFGGVLLYADNYMNVTGEILKILNETYAASK